jgi:hypothetical protein
MIDTVYLASGEVVNLKSLLKTLIEIRWGVEKLQSIVAFGSSVKPVKFKKAFVKKKRFLWWEWNSYKRKYIHPKDIDLLVIYDKRIKQQQAEKTQTSTVRLFVEDGYGGMLNTGTRVANLHLFCVSRSVFEKKVSEREKYATSVFNEGVVIWGENSLISESIVPKNGLYVNDSRFAASLLNQEIFTV